MPNVEAVTRGRSELRKMRHRGLEGVALALVLTGVLASAAPRAANTVEVTTTFDSVAPTENPEGWNFFDLDITINGVVAENVFGGIQTNSQQDATGVVIDYAFDVPKEQVTRLQLFNNGGGILTDFDGIGTAMVEVFDPSDAQLFSGTLIGGNGANPFDLEFDPPLTNVSRVRLSEITNLCCHSAPFIIWRELWAIQDLEPAIDIEKSGSAPDPPSAGDTIDYSFVVTNTGNATLTNVTVTDPLPGLSPIECPDDSLAPGAEMTCTASYVVTQDDVKTGLVENTATVTGDPPHDDLDPVSDEDSATVPLSQAPGIAIDKSGSGPDPLEVGATVDYTFLVTNTGNVTLSNVTVTDPLPGLSPIDCPDDTLAPGGEMTCTASYTVTQEDADAGIVQNTATVTGDPPSGPAVSDDDFAVVPPSQKPGISLEKTGSGPDPLTVGATVDYSFVVTNTGNVMLSNVTVTDPLPGLSPISCPDDTLAPGAETTCTATYTVTQDDVNAGTIENTATATGQAPGDLPSPTDESSATVPPSQASGISIEKSGSGPDPLTVGSSIEYTFRVTNTGNVTLTDVTVTDPLPGLSPISCPGTTLAPGAEMTCTATYTVTQADAEAGVVENTATVTGQTPTGGAPPTDTSTTTVPPAEPVPALPPFAVLLLAALLSVLASRVLRRVRA